ncbi:CpXC domain-containing protein [Streptococcus entericus]|uniref:CpXC domain-containing protein n=1 Tax=Streptococcus entericus TaxID=155680 RepID=UPI000368FB8C|nr:CpXC domain-containing protein [Streptococcus entericus]
MTRTTVEFIACPVCKHQSGFTTYQSINATLEPKLKQQLIDRELFKFYCLNCGEQRVVCYETLYHDMENRLMLYYIPAVVNREQEVARIEEMFSQIKQVEGDRYFNSLDSYNFRIVSDMESFIEKVQIFDAGYDDRVVELMKFVLAPKEEEDIQFSYDHMVFTKVGDDNYQFMFIDEKRAVASLKFSKEMYEHFELEYAPILDDQYFVDEAWAYRTVAKT